MSTQNLPVDPRWVAQELIPYLRYAFSHILPHDADITSQVKRAIDFCLIQPDYFTDGDDLLFERIFLAIARRHKNLAADLNFLTENLEPLAKFLIRRAQLKGSYKLLGRDCHPSDAWLQFEEHSLTQLQRSEVNGQKGRQGAFVASSRLAAPPLSSTVLMDGIIDPRLLNAQAGQYSSPGISRSITLAEDQYFRYQNQLLKEYRAKDLSNTSWCQQLQTVAMPLQLVPPLYDMSGGGPVYSQNTTNHLPNQQQQAPTYVQGLGRLPPLQAPQQASVPPTYVYAPSQSSHTLPTQPKYASGHHLHSQYSMPVMHPPIQPKPAPITSFVPQAQPEFISSTSTLDASRSSERKALEPKMTQRSGITKSGAAKRDQAAQERAEMAAFSKLSKLEKAQILLNLFQMKDLPDEITSIPFLIHDLPVSLPPSHGPSPGVPLSGRTVTQYMLTPPQSPVQQPQQPSLQANSIAVPAQQHQPASSAAVPGQSSTHLPSHSDT